jgi:signal transduction histidine kinase
MIGTFAGFLWMIISWFEYSIDISSPLRDLLNHESFGIVFWAITGGSLIFTFVVIVLIIKEFNELLSLKVRQATSQLRINNEKLRETLKFERDMIDIMGHELRTPISIARNAIFLTNRYLNGNDIDLAKARNYSATALKNTQKEVDLLNTLLTATKIDNNRLELHPEQVDLVKVVNGSMLEFVRKAKEKGLELTKVLPKDSIVWLDKARIQEVMDNLIDNAIKYTEKGFVDIELKNYKSRVVFCVSDSGKGIPQIHIKKLGKKFYRVDNYVDKKGDLDIVRPGGTGLGLYVTFSLVKEMGGTIKITSKERKGSCFKVSLPKKK